MHPAVEALIRSLSFGGIKKEEVEKTSWDPVGGIARVYEVARNAMDYRAEHLVRRAAIERILKRQLVFGSSAKTLAEVLTQELRMARYASEQELKAVSQEEMEEIISGQHKILSKTKVNRDWLIGLFSAEIEDLINPNPDYQRFTTFAFNVYKTRIDIKNKDNTDLLLYTAVDRSYGLSDDAQVAYHLYKLALNQARKIGEINEIEVMERVEKTYLETVKDPLSNRLGIWVRRQMGPLVLLRDMYFANPVQFKESVADEGIFLPAAKMILEEQLGKLQKRMNTAAIRSLIYVFLTKMIFGLLLEIPAERWISGSVNYLAVGINAIFPVILMVFLTGRIKLPGKPTQEKIVKQAWRTVSEFGQVPRDEIYLGSQKKFSDNKLAVFYILYSLLFGIIFVAIVWVLRLIHMGIFSGLVFIFFLSVVSFFAFRIRQATLVYSYRPRVDRRSSLTDTLMLPMVVVGSFLSREVSKLNFLVFIFDFILEAPLKTILRFLDSWADFLSGKRDEVVG